MMIPGFYPVFKRDMTRHFRFKDQLFTSMLHPVLWLVLFGFAMAGTFERLLQASVPPAGLVVVNYLTFMCPGMIAATIMFANLYGGFSVLFDKNWGILREILASPMPRRDLIIGIILSAITKSLIQTVIIIVLGMILGVSTFAGQSPLGIIISIAGIILFIGAFSAAVLCVSLYMAFTTSSPEGYQGITTILSMPLFFASNSLYPGEGLPPGIKELALINPLTHLTNGLRFFTIGDHFTALGLAFSYTPVEIAISFLYLVCLALILFWVTLRTINRAIIT
ncbi:MAG: ABC transporter permease [Methanospirillum sp.]|uniref:ABC transporter permease n=1 Tax=Methanospirillum sp. TaxID=45200 RepID=UPI00237210F9|nr:ABC transporter permease [Methanospirillum sp.]MDD1728609.1 ABC transporter permease [Methanospirillum sp.]